ncbi:hypothetical protein BH23BAC1_BH23BAC1_47830 [soil metagenome]
MLSEFEERPYSTANDFVAALRPSHLDWEGNETIDTGWVFRGQSDSKWSLQPSANRLPSSNQLFCAYYESIKKKFSSHPKYTPNFWEKWVQPHCVKPSHLTDKIWEERITQTSLLALTHATLVREFVMLADRSGHPTHMPDFLWHIENDKETNRHFFGRFFHGQIEKKDIVPFAVAQHHGVPNNIPNFFKKSPNN